MAEKMSIQRLHLMKFFDPGKLPLTHSTPNPLDSLGFS